jgi:hypothetical protein
MPDRAHAADVDLEREAILPIAAALALRAPHANVPALNSDERLRPDVLIGQGIDQERALCHHDRHQNITGMAIGWPVTTEIGCGRPFIGRGFGLIAMRSHGYYSGTQSMPPGAVHTNNRASMPRYLIEPLGSLYRRNGYLYRSADPRQVGTTPCTRLGCGRQTVQVHG